MTEDRQVPSRCKRRIIMAKKVLIVYYSLGGNTQKAAEVVERELKKEGVEVTVKTGLGARVGDLVNCDGLAVGTPDYFSYMAGGLKDFFDRAYYPTQGKVTDKPCIIFVTHGGGGKAVDSVVKVCNSFKFKVVGKPVLVKGSPSGDDEEKLEELGRLMAVGLRDSR